MIMLDKFRGMDLVSWFPSVVTLGIPLPFNEILQLFQPSELSVCDDPFYFVFLFSVDEVRRWSGEVWAVRSCFVVRRQEGRVKYVVDPPVWGQFESVSYRRYLLGDLERAQSFRGELRFLMREFQVGRV